MKNILILNGPNLNLLGRREPEIYGSQDFKSYFSQLVEDFPQLSLTYHQTNHEGGIIDKLHEVGFHFQGIVLNAGGYTHTSISIADAIKAIDTPVVEVHISDISNREPYRKHSYLSAVCPYHVIGKGLAGYKEAIEWLDQKP